MLLGQQFRGSSGYWNNVTLTFDNIVLPPAVPTPYSGDTTGAPTFRRPGNINNLSNIGTAVPYEVVPFYVTADGVYSVETLQAFDSVPLIYSGSFDPDNALANLMKVYNQGLAGDPERDIVLLSTNTQYYLVVTGYLNSDFGPFSGTITNGAGVVGWAELGYVPEPTLLAALPAVALVRRRRSV